MVAPTARRPLRDFVFAWFGIVVLIVMLAAFVGGVLLGGGWIWPFATGVAVMSTGALVGHPAPRSAPPGPLPGSHAKVRKDGAQNSPGVDDSGSQGP